MYVQVRVQVEGGQHHTLSLRVGQSYRDEIRRCGLPLAGTCDSAMICATCHIHLNAAWGGTQNPCSDEEADLLETLPGYGAGSRLSCQTLVGSAHGGLTLQLPATSIQS